MSYPLSSPVDISSPGPVEVTLTNTTSPGGIVWNIETDGTDDLIFGTNQLASSNVLELLPDSIPNPNGASQTPQLNLVQGANTVNLTANSGLAATYNFKFPALAPTGDAQIIASSGLTNVFYDVHAKNTVYVRKNPGPAEFSSVAAAIASIPTIGPDIPSPSNRYVVYIYPGTYNEPAIVVLSYIYIVGMDMNSVVIQPSALGYTLFTMNTLSGIAFLAIGDTDPTLPAIDCYNCGNFVIFHKITVTGTTCQKFLSCVTDNLATDNSTIYLEYADTTAATTYTLLIQDTNILGGFGSVANIENFFTFGHNDDSLIIDGFNSSLLSHASEMTGDGSGNCIRIKNGGSVNIRGMAISDYLNGFFVDNDGGTPNIITAAITYDNNVTNINMPNTLAIGQADGYTAYLKTLVPKTAPFFITNTNQQIITVASKGANFTRVVDALAAITDNSATYRYIIFVGPGEYYEPQLFLKPYVTIVGSFQTQCIIKSDASVAGIPFINCVGYSSINKITVAAGSYATPPSYLIEFLGDPLGTHFRCDDIIVDSSAGLFHVGSANGPTIFIGYNILINMDAPFTTGFIVEDSVPPNNPITFLLDNLLWGAGPIGVTNVTDIVNITSSVLGINIFSVITNSNIGTNFYGPAGNCFVFQGGVFAVLETTLFGGLDNGIIVPPSAIPTILIVASCTLSNNSSDIDVQSATATGSINVNATASKVTINPAAVIGVTIFDPSGSISFGGSINQGATWNTATNISTQIQRAASIGFIESTPVISPVGGLNVSVTGGSGYVMVTSSSPNYLKYVMWGAVNPLVLADNSLAPYAVNWIYVDSAGTVSSSLTEPDYIQNVILGTVRTYGGSVVYVQEVGHNLDNLATNIDHVLRTVFGPIVQYGCIASPGSLGVRQVQIASGRYALSVNIYNPTGADNVSIIGYYNSGQQTTAPFFTVPLDWDNAGVITALGAAEWAKHSFYVLSSLDGLTQSFYMVYGQQIFASELLAQAGPIPIAPISFVGNMLPVAGLVVNGADLPANWTTSRFIDIRPTLSFTASGITATSDHNSLTNLTVGNAHPQYFRVDGTTAMAGNINLAGNNIFGSGGNLLNGVDLLAHASRHLPGGADALATAVPVSVGTVNTLGVAASFSRSDHVHRGVSSIAANGGTAEVGAMNFVGGTNVTIVDSPAGTFTISATGGITSFSAGTTGFTPSVPTTGAITLAGVLIPANGGTGVTTTPTNGQLLIGNGTNYTAATVTSGIGISTAVGPGTLQINNAGVTSIVAGTGISVSGATGAVTVSINASLDPIRISAVINQVSVGGGAGTVIGYVPWQNSQYSSFTTRTVILWAIPSSAVGKNLTVHILPDGGPTIGSVTINGGVAVGGIYTFTFTAPGVDTNLQVSVSRTGGVGNNPVIRGVTITLT